MTTDTECKKHGDDIVVTHTEWKSPCPLCTEQEYSRLLGLLLNLSFTEWIKIRSLAIHDVMVEEGIVVK